MDIHGSLDLRPDQASWTVETSRCLDDGMRRGKMQEVVDGRITAGSLPLQLITA